MKLHRLILGDLCTNCYVLANEKTKDAIVVDAPCEAETILDFLKQQGYHLREIVLTHGHYDHIMALPVLKEKTGVPVAIHQNGQVFLKDAAYNLSDQAGFPWEPMEADRFLQDGDTISVGDEMLTVLHTPGHTADSICLYDGDKILISGDTLFRLSVGRADFVTGDLETEIRSIREKLLVLSDDVKAYPGHGFSTTLGRERKENMYLQ